MLTDLDEPVDMVDVLRRAELLTVAQDRCTLVEQRRLGIAAPSGPG